MGQWHHTSVAPNLSVIVFAQLGVYAYCAAAFEPVHFGTFIRNEPKHAAVAAAATAVTEHYGVWATGQHHLPYFQGVSVKNPGMSTAIGLAAATVVGAARTWLRQRRAGYDGRDPRGTR